MNRILTVLVATAVVAGALAAVAFAHGPTNKTLTIHHQTRGCHSWALVGGSSHPLQRVTLEEGSKLRVVDNDVMPHRLVQTSGTRVHIARAQMGHIGASAVVRFSDSGVYKFKTKAGEDYPAYQNVKTVGEDYTLRLTVTVH